MNAIIRSFSSCLCSSVCTGWKSALLRYRHHRAWRPTSNFSGHRSCCLWCVPPIVRVRASRDRSLIGLRGLFPFMHEISQDKKKICASNSSLLSPQDDGIQARNYKSSDQPFVSTGLVACKSRIFGSSPGLLAVSRPSRLSSVCRYETSVKVSDT